MEGDDPWDWSVDRVVQELCTDTRSWQPRTSLMSIPDPAALEHSLREQEITGSVLLTYVDDKVLRDDFGLKVLGRRAFVREAIEELRLTSPLYEKHAVRHGMAASYQSPSQAGFPRPFPRYPFNPAFLGQPQMPGAAHLTLQFPSLPQPPNSNSASQLLITNGQPPDTTADVLAARSDFVEDGAGNKRRKLDLTNPENNLALQTEDVYLDPNVPSGQVNMLQDISLVEPLSPAPDPSTKKRKRITPTFISSYIDPDRDREIPTGADDVIRNDPSKVEPGVAFIGDDGKKRLVPIRRPDLDTDEPYDYNELLRRGTERQVLDAGGEKSLGAAENILKEAARKRAEATAISLATGYLGKQKMPVDDIFYEGIPVGQELSVEEDSEDFFKNPKEISAGRRLYIHGLMKRFLHSEREAFSRNDKLFSAVRPYKTKLTPKFHNPSFTLFYPGEDSQIHARREPISAWPEINPEAPILQAADDNGATFKPGAWQDFKPYGETFDPDSLVKWKNYDGGDEVLPVYGDSDEENEYDEETWKEIEEEQHGTLEKPLMPLKRPLLSLSEVHQAIDEGIAEMITQWHSDKKPKKQQKAFHLWKMSRSHDIRQAKLKSLRNQISRLNEIRIPKLRKEIASEQWTSWLQVRKQTRSMEQSIFDRESTQWELKLTESVTPPEKPLPKPRLSKKLVISTENSGEGESLGSDTEAEVSSSDEDMDGFIVDDSDEEVIEPNLADSEDEAEDDGAEDAMSDAGPSEIPLLPSLASKKPIMSFIEDPFPDADQPGSGGDTPNSEASINRSISTPHHSSSSQTPIKTSPSKEESALPKLPSSPPKGLPEMVDLTMISSDDAKPKSKPIVDLATPRKKKSKLIVRISNSPFQSPIMISDGEELSAPDPNNRPSLDDPDAIAKFGPDAWSKLGDSKRLLIAILHLMDPSRRELIFSFVSDITEEDLWSNMEQVMNAHLQDKKGVRGVDTATFQTLVCLIRLFQMFAQCKRRPFESLPKKKAIELIQRSREKLFPRFYEICSKFGGYFGSTPSMSQKQVDEGSNDDEGLQSANKRRRPINTNDEDRTERRTAHKKRVKPIFEDLNARKVREEESQRVLELEERRRRLQSRIAMGDYAGSQNEIIINESKFDDQGLIHVSPLISGQIKQHQIEGVRFMWNQVVTNDKLMQGCLLAHTMGLGKTMQVITLLVAIAEASGSIEESIYDQIPIGLRTSKTLILCPPTLIDNWMDELLTWTPADILGNFRKVDSSIKKVSQRLDAISAWFHNGGILVMGYDMFRNYVINKTVKNRGAPLDENQHKQIKEHLLQGPNIIVADEAHKMKNAISGIAKAAVQFRSRSRIALTGSPLANNVEEYHTMIEWVAPNYLGPIVEFRAKYAEPIQQGLWHDSDAVERRRSLKMLGALTKDIAPKVNRADMSVLRNDLPPKKEFVVTVPLTDLQKKAYSIYVRSIVDKGSYATTKSGEATQTTLWHWLAVLVLLCNHPACFNAKLNERKEEVQKELGNETAVVSRDNTDQEEVVADDLDDSPIWKVGVSQELINEVTALFKAEAPDLKAIELSNKVKILCQILDGSRAVGDKVLVFSQSLQTLDFIEELCKAQGRLYGRLDGKTKMNKRQNMTKDFNAGNLELYLISTAAGGLGLNLPGANRVVIFDFKFNPIMEEQAIGRAYRIGQKKPVFIYRFVAGGTFENSVHNKTIFKMQLASRVVDKKNPIAYASRRLSDFLFEPKHVEQQELRGFSGIDPVLDKILATQDADSTIRAIVQSDTFERDDEDKLTAAEQKEVDQMVSDKQLERSDPNAYQKMIAQRQRQELQRYQHAQQSQAPQASSSMPSGNAVSSNGLQGISHQAQPSAQGAMNAPRSAAATPDADPSLRNQVENGPPTAAINSANPSTPGVTAYYPTPGRSPIAGANTKVRSVTPEAGPLPSPEKEEPRRARSATPVEEQAHVADPTPIDEQSPPETESPPAATQYSKKIFELLLASLMQNAAAPSKKAETFSNQASAGIMASLIKHETDSEARKVVHRDIVIALEADPAKCEALAKGQAHPDEFVLQFVKPSSAQVSKGNSGMADITNTQMFKAMSKVRKPQPPQSLRTPVTAPQRKGSHADGELKYKSEANRLIKRKRKLVTQSPSSVHKRSGLPPMSPPAHKIPKWQAESEIREASKDKHKRDSRAS